MGCVDAMLQPMHVQRPYREIDLAPFQGDKLTHSEPMPIGQQDHCCIAMVWLGNISRSISSGVRYLRRFDILGSRVFRIGGTFIGSLEDF
jgi:hypothetical protein